MRYSLLNFVVCPRCHCDLTAVTLKERACEVSPIGLAWCGRVSPAGALVGPVPAWTAQTELTEVLSHLSSEPAPAERNYEAVVETGILTCGGCGGWYPVIDCVPELMPGHLRNLERDLAWLACVSGRIPEELLRLWQGSGPSPAHQTGGDAGAHYKLAEINLPTKISDPSWWGPGYTSPFNVSSSEHTWHLIRNFAVAEPLLELSQWQTVLDVGCGFSWTTEWFLRSGYEPVGIDICRKYLEIALARIGTNRPHLLVGDVEHLPIRRASMRAVLALEAFHHVPDRAAAMREFGRVLADGCPVVLVEPGQAHEHAAVSVAAMKTYGTLEKGMELSDVASYAKGSGLGECRQHRIIRTAASRGGRVKLSKDATSLISNQIYTLRKVPQFVLSPADRLRARVAPRLLRAAAWLRRTRAEIRMRVDRPLSGEVVSCPLAITGWALDPRAPSGSGIGPVHVWARRRDDGDPQPVFLGAAHLGIPRPDTAAAFGGQFGGCGFSLTALGLTPGDYDVSVHAWNRRTARWEDARTVAVTVR